MKEDGGGIDRRGFLGTMGAAALGSVLGSSGGAAESSDADSAVHNAQKEPQPARSPRVPRRTLGKTGIEIPVVGLGALWDARENPGMLDRCLQYGVAYWDTASNYSNTRSEQGIGHHLAAHPGLRETLFIVTKTDDLRTPLPDVASIEKELQDSLKRLNTHYIDLYCGVHALWNPAQLTDEVKEWAAEAKRRGLIRHFGFSTHKNMAQALAAAAKLDWVDAILTGYNFQLMQDPELQAAIDACHEADIGLIAIKTQRNTTMREMNIETDEDRKLTDHFIQRGYTAGQAKLKVVLEDTRITAAAVGMRDPDILATNVAAAVDRTTLTRKDKAVLEGYARATCNRYCTGCAHICDAALPDVPYVSDIMRYLTYYNSYGHHSRARRLFARIPADVRARLLDTDYTPAEARCPQRLPIARIVREAVGKLA